MDGSHNKLRLPSIAMRVTFFQLGQLAIPTADVYITAGDF